MAWYEHTSDNVMQQFNMIQLKKYLYISLINIQMNEDKKVHVYDCVILQRNGML